MKSLPDMVPEYPKKAMRITLDPVQAVTLWSFVNHYVEVTEDLDGHTDKEKFFLAVMSSIEGALSDRLTFRAKGDVQ